MSFDQPQTPQDWSQQPAPKPGMSTGKKVLVILGIIFAVLLVICCGGGVGLMWWGKSYVEDAASKDPKVVAAKTDEITQISVPPALKPMATWT